MTQVPTQFDTTQGYAPPVVTQFSVFLENKVGKLHELAQVFDDGQARICALAVHEAADHAVVRIITGDAKVGQKLLRERGWPFTTLDLLVVELGNEHSLARLCMYLLGAELSIRFAYPLMLRPGGAPTIALAVDDVTLAGQILRRKEFRLLGEADLPRGADPVI